MRRFEVGINYLSRCREVEGELKRQKCGEGQQIGTGKSIGGEEIRKSYVVTEIGKGKKKKVKKKRQIGEA